MIPFFLGSASPARKRLLESAGIRPTIVPGAFDESLVQENSPERLVATLARAKFDALLPAIRARPDFLSAPRCILLTCDSMLFVDGRLQGKPETVDEAIRRWKLMRGRTGFLYTGHCLSVLDVSESIVTTEESVRLTEVDFANVTDIEIERYAATGEPLRCAGAFALEGLGGAFVSQIRGCHSNVIGLSVPLLREMVLRLGVEWTYLWAPDVNNAR